MDAPIWPFVSFQSARYAVAERSLERRRAAGVLSPAARLQRGADDRRVEEVAGLLHARVLAVSVQAVPDPGISGVRNVRAVVSEHDSVFRGHRLHRGPDRRQIHRLRLLRHRARARASMVGTPDRGSARARRDDSRGNAGAIFRADGHGARVRSAEDAALPEVRTRQLSEESRRRTDRGTAAATRRRSTVRALPQRQSRDVRAQGRDRRRRGEPRAAQDPRPLCVQGRAVSDVGRPDRRVQSRSAGRQAGIHHRAVRQDHVVGPERHRRDRCNRPTTAASA